MSARIDVNAWIGRYPWRDAGESTGNDLIAEMVRLGTSEAWVSHIGAVWWRDPMAGNAELYRVSARDPRLRPVAAVHPGLPGWTDALELAVAEGAPAMRCDPTFYGLAPAGSEVQQLLSACAAVNVPLMMAVRLEDLRQRHPNDVAGDLPAWAVRELLRSHPDARLIITHADRDFIEQVHFGSTPGEAARVLWDISWVWGPPEDQLELLLQTVGVERFVFGTGMPLRLPEAAVAKLDLLELDTATRRRIEAGNVSERRETRDERRGW